MGFETSYILNKKIDVELKGNAERAALLDSFLKTEFYNEGVEEKLAIEGYAQGNGSVTKEEGYLNIKVENNPTQSAVKTVVLDKGVDLTDVNWVYLDFEMTGTAGYDTRAYLQVSTSKLLTYTDYVLRKEILLSGGVAISRNTVKLNVSGLTGAHFIKVQLRDASTVVDVPATIKIYGISTLNTPSGGIRAIDSTGESVKLTAELDDNGKAVLRIIDAAPAAYDPAKDSLRVSTMPKKRKKQLQVSLANMPIGTTDISVYTDLNTLGKITSIAFSIGGIAAPATSGTHAVQIYDRSFATANLLYSISAPYWDNLQLFRTHKANGTEDSGTTYAILQQIINSGLHFGDNTSVENPLIIRYKNDSNAIRTNTAYILINYIEESIG